MADGKAASVAQKTEPATQSRVKMVNENKMNGKVGATASVLAEDVPVWTAKGWAKAK
ncbi:MAG: hypothetical protein ACPGSI_13170 [Pikeienuella sp.]